MVHVHVTPQEDSSDAEEVAWAHRLGRKLQEEFKPYEDGEVVIHAKASAYGYGQIYNDIDVVVVGVFPNGIVRPIECMVNVKDNIPRKTLPGELIRFYSFCLTVEIKATDPKYVQVVGLNDLQVRYKDSGWKSATDQSEGQKQALKAILFEKTGLRFWVNNAIWLTSFERTVLPVDPRNVLAKIVTLNDLLAVCCNERPPYQSNPGSPPLFSALNREDQEQLDVSALSRFLQSLKKVEVQSLGSLSRKRLEQLTAKLIDDQQYVRAIGKQLVIIRGKAGTGKTVKLLRLAHDLAKRDGARIRILTYNLALVSDIRRLVALAGINDDTAGSIEPSSLDKFFYELITVSGFGTFDYDRYFDNKATMIRDIQEAFDAGVISDTDIASWLERREFRFDYIFVDEGQDWPREEQAVLLRVFGPSKIVVGDGVDQMVRGPSRSEWSVQVPSNMVHRVPPERRCLRQKYNLNEFNRAIARASEQHWDLESRTEFPGGRLIISLNGYTRSLHEKLWQECQDDGNKGYEMLFMVPPSLADHGRGFQLREHFESWGMHLWDGTVKDTRKEYPTELSEHRVVQFESCRGLEAWTGVCMHLDEIFELKTRTWQRIEDQLSMEDDEVLRIRDAFKWCMIPLTRAIDTTVITLSNSESVLSRTILKVAQTMPDFAQIV